MSHILSRECFICETNRNLNSGSKQNNRDGTRKMCDELFQRSDVDKVIPTRQHVSFYFRRSD